ncbi:MAG: tRNA (adenosine(37)-N6)-threonylcarbamoyltransferase complex ATPase subunit type 1 TsaE [Alloprevotella sp.]
MKIEISTLHNIHSAAQAFLEATDVNRVFAFYGKMGAGKTTFIKALCEELGVEDAVNSPTFAIVNEYYSTRLDGPIFHFDFYRIKRIEEAFDIGTDDYFYSGAPCFIEWPELIEDILPEETVRVSIEEQPDGTRTIEFDD